uniref:Ly6/neurotoxin 9 n=1 Tax=Locusta migratoria manilensis TaxID=229990 RepID=A0A1Y0F494_LOCMI|nr:ly6/neurotoxin 9 [Locusta migratoria manilensis]
MSLRSAASVPALLEAMSDATCSPMGLLVTLVLASAVLRPASALNCYLCRSSEDPSCATNPQTQGDCDEYLAENVPQGNYTKNSTHCLSLVYTTESGRKFTERMCVPVPDQTDPCIEATKVVTVSRVETCSICTEDLCNSSGRSGSILTLYILLLYYMARLLLT